MSVSVSVSIFLPIFAPVESTTAQGMAVSQSGSTAPWGGYRVLALPSIGATPRAAVPPAGLFRESSFDVSL